MWPRHHESGCRPAPVLIVAVLLTAALSPAFAQGPYPDTVAALKSLYGGEMHAMKSYLAFAEKARSEDLPEIAALFDAFAVSESIHARNFKLLLEEMGEGLPTAVPSLKVEDTKENLRYATEVELAEIDTIYPETIERIQAEKHARAATYATYAWRSEKQHRELIREIQSGTGVFFELLKKEFKANPRTYFVCSHCGSTLDELPPDRCPICGGPASNYRPAAEK